MADKKYPKSDTFLRGLASKRKGYTDLLPSKKKFYTMLIHENVAGKGLSGKKRMEARKVLRRLSEQPSGLQTGGRALRGYGKAYMKGGKVK